MEGLPISFKEDIVLLFSEVLLHMKFGSYFFSKTESDLKHLLSEYETEVIEIVESLFWL